MSSEYPTPVLPRHAAPLVATHLHQQLATWFDPFLRRLDRHLDARLVRTCLAIITAILMVRHRACGLLLSELGSSILAPAQVPAGTKRLSALLRSPKWSAALIHDFLWH